VLVWVASYPRSGNTLTMLVLRDVFGVGELGRIVAEDLGLGRFARSLPPPVTPRPPYRLPPELKGLTGPALIDAVSERAEPFFIRTHRLVDARVPAPALYIVRDGRDALVSHARIIEERGTPRAPDRVPPALRELREAEDEYRDLDHDARLRQLIKPGIPGYGDWSENVRTWRTRQASTAVIRYEELVVDPATTVRQACDSIGVPLPAPTGELASF
jgi:hypothetical protein